MKRTGISPLLVIVVVVLGAAVAPTWSAFSADTASSVTFEAAPSFCSAAGEATVEAEADTYVSQQHAGTNYGDDPALHVRSWQVGAGDRPQRALVRFPDAGIPEHCTVTSATLRLYATDADPGRTIDVYRIAAPWEEMAVTWSTQPPYTGVPSTFSSASGWIEVEVTEHVEAMLADEDHGFLVRDRDEGARPAEEQIYSSREGANPPQLTVDYE